MTDLTTLSIADAGRLMASGELTSTILTEAFLARIGAVDHKLASYITVTGDLARSAAKQADMERAGGLVRGPLHGIPIALKDIYETAGVKTTGHSHLKVDYVPAIDAETVRRLKSGGAIILGKLATHEFANGAMTPDQPFPAARNPWNTDYQPGGSSSGSGAAVAGAHQVRADHVEQDQVGEHHVEEGEHRHERHALPLRGSPGAQEFHGRDEEAAELARRVQRKNLTVLFGQSGLGKTSLLRAGLVPRLRGEVRRVQTLLHLHAQRTLLVATDAEHHAAVATHPQRAAGEFDAFARAAFEFRGGDLPIRIPQADAFPVDAGSIFRKVVSLFGRNGGRRRGEFGHRSGQCGFLFRGQRPFFGRRQQVPDEVTHHFIRQFSESRRHQADAGVLQGLDLVPGHDFLAGANAQHAHARRRVFGHPSTQSATVLGGNDDVLVSVTNDLVGIDDVIE